MSKKVEDMRASTKEMEKVLQREVDLRLDKFRNEYPGFSPKITVSPLYVEPMENHSKILVGHEVTVEIAMT